MRRRELGLGAGEEHQVQPLGELVEGEPSLAGRDLQPLDHPLAVGVGDAEPLGHGRA